MWSPRRAAVHEAEKSASANHLRPPPTTATLGVAKHAPAAVYSSVRAASVGHQTGPAEKIANLSSLGRHVYTLLVEFYAQFGGGVAFRGRLIASKLREKGVLGAEKSTVNDVLHHELLGAGLVEQRPDGRIMKWVAAMPL